MMMIGLSLGLCSATGQGGVPNPLPAIWASGELGDYWEAFGLTGTLDATVQTLAGRLARHDFTQATAGSRPVLKARADGVRYLDFASAKSMAVAASTALFKYLHDGTGGEVIAFVEYPQSEVASNFLRTATATTNSGIQIGKSSATQGAAISICRSASGTTTVSGGSLLTGSTFSERLVMLCSSYKNNGGANDFEVGLDSCRTIVPLPTSLAPSSADAGQNLTIESTFGGKLYALLVINRKLTSAERAALYVYWRSKIEYPVPTPDYTILVGGQSNASSRGALAPTWTSPRVGVYMRDKAEEYRLAYEPSHSIANRPVATSPDEGGITVPQFSFILPAGAALKTDANIVTMWVPCAIGSTTLANWNHPESVGDRTTLFGAAHHRVTRTLAEKGGAPVIVWWGHESDANLPVPDYVNGGVGTAYQTAWASLIANIRSKIADAPLIMVQLASDDTLATAIGNALVAEAQRQSELSLSRVYMVVAHDVPRNVSPDDIHVSKAGQQTVGERIALAFREHILGQAVNGTGPRNASVTYSGSTVTLTLNKAINTTAGNYGNLFRVYANGVEQTVSSAGRNGSDTSKIDIVCSAPLTGPITLTYGHRAGPASAARTDFVKDADGLPLPVFGPIAVPAA